MKRAYFYRETGKLSGKVLSAGLALGLGLGCSVLGTGWRTADRHLGAGEELKVGVAAIAITPFGPNPDWHGQVTASGVWGERFTDLNHNGRWDPGEPFEDDPANSRIDSSSEKKYDGIYLAGFGRNRMATGKLDDIWARALVLESGATKIAIVAVDLIGYYSKANYYGAAEVQKQIDPALGITDVLIASTHDHEAPDTIGPWGPDVVTDGKYPEYLQFVDRQIANAITLAGRSAVPVRMKLGRTDPILSPSIAGMQTRTFGRPPDFYDQELRVMQFVGTGVPQKDKVVATLVNWNTHPESLESENTLISSDFPGEVRREVEKKYGGTAVYVSGDLGAVEIIGDSNNKTGERITFDGKTFPLSKNTRRPGYSFERTVAIGRDVAKAVFDAIGHAEWSAVSGIDLRKTEISMKMDNIGYLFLARKGVLDTMPLPVGDEPPVINTTVYAITIGDAQIITAPGELFPEVFYGVEKHRRRDCSQADTGRPPEVAVRDLMTGKYKFVFGLCPDEFGYMVPGYDFRPPIVDGLRGDLAEAHDPCKSGGVPDHYHETNSASSQLAPAWSCAAARLLSGKPQQAAACQNLQ
jgi:hypothetical protein